MLGQLSVILKVPPSQLLLLREEEELSPQLTVDELRLGIADIIGESHDLCGSFRFPPGHCLVSRSSDCVVMATEEQSSSITVRLQSRDRGSSQSFSVLRVGSCWFFLRPGYDPIEPKPTFPVLPAGRSAGLHLLPVPVRRGGRRSLQGQIPVRRDAGDGRADGGAAGHGGRRHRGSLDLSS